MEGALCSGWGRHNITPRNRRTKRKFGAHVEVNIKRKAPTETYGEQKAPVEAYNEQETLKMFEIMKQSLKRHKYLKIMRSQ